MQHAAFHVIGLQCFVGFVGFVEVMWHRVVLTEQVVVLVDKTFPRSKSQTRC